jgi:hypothetical protein
MPEVYLNTFTPSCELFSLELATKFPNVTVAKVPLPDGSWYSSNKKPLAQAYCAAYISSPRAFDGYEKEMQLFNCELPFSQRTRNAVKQLADTVTQTYDSVSGMTTGSPSLLLGI